MQESVTIDQKEFYTSITFFDPASNSLPGATLENLVSAISKCASHASNTILLQSAGERAFCAGASFGELTQIQNDEQGLAFFSGFGNVINAMRTSPKIIISRVQGKAVGGGVGLISASDFSIASRYASVRLSELAIGIGPFVIGPAVERKIGTSAFRKLALTPEDWQTAQWAQAHGLYDEVFDEMEQVNAYINHLAGKWAAYSPEALRELKKVFWEGTDHWPDLLKEKAGISGRLIQSEFTKNAIAQRN